MKKYICFVFIFLIATTLKAQYIPNNAQTFQFMPLLNPAFSGIEPFNDLKFSYRYQWSGFGDYAPKFLNLSYHTRLVEPLDLTYNSLRLSEPAAANPISDILFGKTGPRGGHHEGIIESVAKSAARSVGSGLGRQVLRGVLGSLFGGKR